MDVLKLLLKFIGKNIFPIYTKRLKNGESYEFSGLCYYKGINYEGLYYQTCEVE